MSDSNSRNNVKGMMFMTLHAMSVSVIFTYMKYLSQFFRSAELVFFYKFMLFIAASCWVLFKGVRCLIVPEIRWILARGLISSIASISFMYALKYVDMVNASALAFLEQVIWVIIGILFFNERLTVNKFLLIAMSMAGAVIIIFPDIFNRFYEIMGFQLGISYTGSDWHYLLVMVAVMLWGINAGIVKKLTKTVKVEVQLFYTMLFAVLLSFTLAYVEWNYIEVSGRSMLLPSKIGNFNSEILKLEYFKYLIIIALCYFIHNISFFFAMKNAQFAVVIPFDYSRLIFSGIFAYLMLDKIPEFNSYIGYFLILFSSMILLKINTKAREK